MIVNHLKSQGLFDQFRRDCLADVDTKPAYQNLRQRVDNFVSNHLATHTWSPHLNKNQLRNNIRQQVLKSGMLESGIDRIISQVVDPKINHTFRPQVEKAVHEFLATLNHKEEASANTVPDEERPDSSITTQGVSAAGPSANVANDAMSILETITSLNQEASAARASTETPNPKNAERVAKRLMSQQSIDASERDRNSEDVSDKEKPISDLLGEGPEPVPKSEDIGEIPNAVEEVKTTAKDSGSLVLPTKDNNIQESSDQKTKPMDKSEKKSDSSEKAERKKDKKEKTEKKSDHSKRNEDLQRAKDDKQLKDREADSVKQLPSEKNSNKSRTIEGTKEDFSSIDSDMDGLTDITVSSVHTSDLSSFDEESEEEFVVSESTEEGEITSDDEEEDTQKSKAQTVEPSEGKAKNVRHAYVHKPYLYSKYYSDSDDELTVEQHRQSIAREKEERLLRRQVNREKLEEKRKQKAADKSKSLKNKSQGKNNVDLEESSRKLLEPKATRTKEVLKERRVLEKKVALSKKRKKDSRHVEESCKKKYHSEEESKEALKINEHCEKLPTSKEPKHIHAKSEPSKPARRLSESLHTTDENRSESKMEREHKRRASTSLEGAQPDPEIKEAKRQMEKPEISTEETQKPKSILKNEKHPKKDNNDSEMHLRSVPKKEVRSYREKSEKERTLSEDKLSTKHKYKGDGVHKIGDETELHSSERNSKADESGQKQSQQIKVSSDDKADKKSKHRNEKKISLPTKDGKTVSENTLKTEESLRKENSKKDRHLSVEKARSEHKSRRSSDSKVQRDCQGSKQHSYTSQRRSESYSDDKCDAESTNSEHLKAEDNVHRDRRRTKSLLEEKSVLKSKSKSHSKPSRAGDADVQESATKQEAAQKSDREKNTEESDADKPRKPKNEEKSSEETSVETSELESNSCSGSQKDSGYRVKLPAGEKTLVKEKHKSDKDVSLSKLERKLSIDCHKSRSSKHSGKETKRKEENIKSEEKDSKEIDSHEKVKGNSVVMEKKSSKRLCENRRGSPSSQEMSKTEDKLATSSMLTAQTPLTQRQRKGGENSSVPDQEPMEVDSEQVFENILACSRTQDKNNSDPKPDVDSESTSKLKTSFPISRSELRSNPGDFQVLDSACKPECHFRTESNSEKNAEHKNVPIKEPNVQVSKKEKESIQQGAFQINLSCDTSKRSLLNIPSENARTQKNLKNIAISSEENMSLSGSSSQGGDALKHSINTNSSESMACEGNVPQKDSRHLDKPCLTEGKTALESKTAHPSGSDLSESPRTSSDIKENKVTQTSSNREENRKRIIMAKPAKESLAAVRSLQDCDQRRGEANLMTDTVAKDENMGPKEFVLMELDKKAKDVSVPGVSVEQGTRANVGAEQKEEEGDTGSTIGTSTEKEATRLEVPKKAIRNTVMETEEAGNLRAGIEKGNENSEVGTSAGRGGVPVIQSREQTAGNTSIGTSSEEKASIASVATSTEGKDESLTTCAIKSSDATTSSTVTEEREVSLSCTSIEADEGFTTGACAQLGHTGTRAEADDSTIVAAAEEGGGVTEGCAESETLLTSTKEGGSGECTMTNTEESGKDAVSVHTVENVNSAGTEEKDDAVTSAGSEEKCEGSSSGDSGVVGAVTCVSEVESDGAVTSAGTEVLEGSLSSEDADGCQRSIPRTSQKKETEGAVTCTGAEERSGNFAICSVTGADAQGEDNVTGASIAVVGDDSIMGPSSNQEGEDSTNDGAEGESAVTSTGIMEEEVEGTTSCTGSEESREGFAICSEPEENGESPMDSTVVKDITNLSLSTVGPCDDEGIVTSTGAKEEDEEDEGMVSSTGRGNEIGSASTCTGIEEGEGALACLSAEDDESLVCTAAEPVESEAGLNTNGSDSVDSMSGEEKEVGDGAICSSAKEVVESSVTSASVESALMAVSEKPEEVAILADLEENGGPMTSAATDKSDSQLSPEEKEEDATISTGTREDDDVLRSEAAPEDQVPLVPAGGKEDEQAITSVENEGGGSLLATAAPESGPGKESKGNGLMISTSTVDGYRVPPLSSAGEAKDGQGGGDRAEGGGEDPMISLEIEAFEAPTPSAATEAEAQLGVAGNEKDECAMISTSIVEEFEAPMSSAALENKEMPPPVATTEEVKGDTLSVEAEDYEAPMSSAVTELQSQLASTSKEEKDECALISTSIVEECEAPVSSEVGEGKEEYRATGRGEKGGSSVIPTSSMGDCEGPVSSAIPRGEGHLSATNGEETNDTAMISTSTIGDCEVIVTGALPQSEPPLAATRMEEISDASVISTSTTEEGTLVLPSVDRRKNIQLVGVGAGEKDEGATISAGKGGTCDIPMPSVIVVNEEGNSAGSVTDDGGGGSQISASLEEENEGPSTNTLAGEKAQMAVASSEGKDESGLLAEDISKTAPFSSRGENDNSSGIINVGPTSDPGEEGEKKEGDKTSSSGRLESAAGSEAAENRLALLSGSEEVSGNVKSDSMLTVCHSAAAGSAEDKAADAQVAKVISLELSGIVCEETWRDENLSSKDEKRTSGSGPKIDTSRSRTPPGGDEPPLLTSECETEVTVNSDHNENLIFEATVEKSDSRTGGPRNSDDTKKSVDVEGGPVINVSSENTVCSAGNEETLPEGLEELELKTNLKTESVVPSGKEEDHFEEPPEDLCGNGGNGLVEPGKNPAAAKESNAKTLDPQTNEETHSCKEKAKSLESSQDVKEYVPCSKAHIQEAVRCPTPKRKLEEVEISSQEEESQPPERKRKKHTLSDENDFDVPDSRREDRQSQCSEVRPQVLQEGHYESTEEISQESVKKSSTVSEIVADKGESIVMESTGEKATQSEDTSVRVLEEDQPVVVKRKRGRPRKYPLEDALKTKEDSKTEAAVVNTQQSPSGGKGKITATGDSHKEINLQERNLASDDGEDKTVVTVRRRGRKPKRSFTLSEETETSEPERKRQKSVSETVEDKKEPESEEEEEEEEDEEDDEKHLRATTRSASRLEAQRKQPSKPTTRAASKLSSPETVSPRNRQKLSKEKLSTTEKVSKSPPLGRPKAQLSPSKRKREPSPPAIRTRGQQKGDETPGKKARR